MPTREQPLGFNLPSKPVSLRTVMCTVFSTVVPTFGACNRLELSPIVHKEPRAEGDLTVLGNRPHGGWRDMEN